MAKIVLGGTFDRLHRGHEALFEKALSLGRDITIGLCSNEFAESIKKRRVSAFSERKKKILEFFSRRGAVPRIIWIRDVFGPTLEEDFDYLVLSEETLPGGEKINEERKKMGKKPLRLVVVELVRENGEKISSRDLV